MIPVHHKKLLDAQRMVPMSLLGPWECRYPVVSISHLSFTASWKSHLSLSSSALFLSHFTDEIDVPRVE